MRGIRKRMMEQKRSVCLLLAGIFWVLIVMGGQQSLAVASDRSGIVSMGELDRTYHVHLPAAYNGSQQYPVVIVLHGAGGDGRQIAAHSGFSRLADQENFIAVYPDGYKRMWAAGWRDSSTYSQGPQINDVAFIRQMIDNLSRDYAIDQHKIFVTGMSMGGMFSHRLAMELSDRIAAIAPVSGTMPDKLATRQANGKVPVLMIHGTDDSIVPYGGGRIGSQQVGAGKFSISNLSVIETARYWAVNNGCQTEPVIEKTIDHHSGDGTKVVVSRYHAPDGRNDVWVYTVEGGGHTWPRTAEIAEGGQTYAKFRETLASRLGTKREGITRARANLGTTSKELDAAEIIWQFFKSLG